MYKWRIVKRNERGNLVFYWQCAGDDVKGLTFEEAEYANNYLHSQGVDSFIEVYSDTLYSVEWSKE